MRRIHPAPVAIGVALAVSTAVAMPWALKEEARFDPALEASGTLCNPTDGKKLLSTYLKVAQAKTEVGPFHNRIDAGRASADAVVDAPLLPDMGEYTFPVTTRAALAQRYFDQGMKLAFGFNHGAARRSFLAAQKADPDCAMCYWGEALVLGPNINMPMDEADLAPAQAAVRKALALTSKAAAPERALIEALGQRYLGDGDRPALDAAYADAMVRVAAQFPRNADIATLTAEALMDLSPWDYWEAGGAKPKGRTAETVAAIERALMVDPQHPGAIHFYIHILEASTEVQRSVKYAERLARVVPGAGHLVHMPSHTFYRVGRYVDSLNANKAAVAADERYLARVAADPMYRYGYYPHNVHFLMVSAQMAGDGTTAIAAADKLGGLLSDDLVAKLPWLQPVKVAPYFAHAQFSDPATILALPDPGPRFPYVQALWHYARGVAYAALGDAGRASAEAAFIDTIARTADFAGAVAGGLPATDVLALSTHVLRARVAQRAGRHAEAVAELEQAVAIEDGLAYMEPPFWYHPLRQSLGAARLLNGDLAGAERDLLTSLARTPNNGWALFGLLEVHQRSGNRNARQSVQARFDQTWAGDPSILELERL